MYVHINSERSSCGARVNKHACCFKDRNELCYTCSYSLSYICSLNTNKTSFYAHKYMGGLDYARKFACIN